MQKVRAEISLRNIRHNAESFLSWTKKPLCAVVKANAYGHGAEEVANALSPYVSAFAVSLIEEAIAIRTAACGKEILVFTPPTNEEECYHLAINGFIASITDEGVARLIMGFCKKYALPMRAHIKVNTGMNRYGLELGSLERVCATLRREKLIFIEGVYSHLYKNNRAVCYAQREKFSSAVSVCKLFYPNAIAHLGATYGAMLGKDFFFDGLRIGLGLYGYLPTCEEKVKTALSLKKGMQVYAKGVSTRIYQFGGVGYGEGCAREGERLSLLRFGYADGYLRDRKNGVENWQKNKNELCMDVTIREGNVKKGAWTPILTDADAVAKTTGTIAYEVLCAATRRAEFIYRN